MEIISEPGGPHIVPKRRCMKLPHRAAEAWTAAVTDTIIDTCCTSNVRSVIEFLI